MSRERCPSSSRASHEKQKSHKNCSGDYIPGGSANRSQRTNAAPHHYVPSSTPDICRSNYPGTYGFPQNQFEPRRLFQYGCDDLDKSPALEPREIHPEYYSVKSPQLEDLPHELLDEYTEPSYFEPPVNASYDDLMCAFATPPPPLKLTNHLEERAEMVTTGRIDIDDGRRHVVDHRRTDSKADDPLCPYEVQPRPDDPNIIPPHPKDPNDFVGIIRRARAIQRLGALEEESASNFPNHRRLPAVGQKTRRRIKKPQPSTKEPPQIRKRVAKKKKEGPPNGDNPPDNTDPEFAAAVLRARKMAGLKTKNSKLLHTSKSPPSPTHQQRHPPAPTYESIMERAAAIRAKRYPVTENPMNTTDFIDHLDEFEAMEQLYNAKPDQCAIRPREENVNVVVDRIDDLQRQLFQSPTPNDCSSPSFELPPIIRYYDLMKRHEEMLAEKAFVASEVYQVPEYKDDLEQLQGIADWDLADLSGSPVRSSPTAASAGIASSHVSSTLSPEKMPTLVCPPDPNNSLDDTFLQNVETPPDIFSTEAWTDAGCLIQDEVALGDISMPFNVLEEDATLYEMALEDVTSPELDDLSVSMSDDLAPHHPTEFLDYESDETVQIVEDEEENLTGGFLTTVVSAVVDKLRNMFAGSPREIEEEDIQSINLDSSLPNLFETTPPQRPTTPSGQVSTPQQTVHEVTDSERSIAIPSHPKDPMIQNLKAEGSKKSARVAKKTKSDQTAKIYPPADYSPGHVAAVARARVLAGYKNRSAVFNPQRAASIAAFEAERVAAEEALPPVERMQRKIARIIENRGQLLCARPSIEALGTLQAIKECMPKPNVPQPSIPKWTPAVRRVNRKNHAFSKKFDRAFGKFQPMTPIREEAYSESDLMSFSPLRPHEGRLRLQYLRERSEQMPTNGEECPQTSSLRTPETAPVPYSPITLLTPTENRRKESITTTHGENGGEESIREVVIETSTLENGEVHTTTRKITKKTDNLGNVTCHVEEGRELNGDEIMENIDTIEAPEFLDTSEILPPRDSSMPSPSEIIERIRVQVQDKLKHTLPEVPSAPEEPATLQFPEDLSHEQLDEIEIPDLEMTSFLKDPQASKQSPNVSLPYCWGEIPESTHHSQYCLPTPPKAVSPVPQRSQAPKPQSPDRQIVIPPHPKDPKDYVAIVKRAQAIQKLQKQQEGEIAAHPSLYGPSLKGQMTKSKKRGLKKSGHLINEDEYRECSVQPPPIPADYIAAIARARQLAGYKNITAEQNPAVGENFAAKKSDDKEPKLPAFEALPAYEQILQRMDKVRCAPIQKRKLEPTADVLGMIAAIRENITPIVEVVRLPTSQTLLSSAAPVRTSDKSHKTAEDLGSEGQAVEVQVCPSTQKSPGSYQSSPTLDSVDKCTRDKIADISLEEFEALEKQMACPPQVNRSKNCSLDEFEELERQMACSSQVCGSKNISLDEFEELERQEAAEAAYSDNRLFDSGMKSYKSTETPKGRIKVGRPRNLIQEDRPLSPAPRVPQNKIMDYRNFGKFNEMENINERLPDKQTCYNELIADFVNKLQYVLPANVLGDLMASTPVGHKERIRQIKEAQQRSFIPRNLEVHDEAYISPTAAYSPITLTSPSDAMRSNQSRDVSQVQMAKDDILLDLHTPKIHHARLKQFRDLEDIPFDELEFEDEPTLTNVSFDKAPTPPPQPSELINRIRQQVLKRLREDKSQNSQICTFDDLRFPDQFPEDELFELSAPSFVQSPISQSADTQKTPNISLPHYAWGEAASATSSPCPTRTPIRTQEEIDAIVECPKMPSPDGPLIIPPHPKDPKDYAAIVKRAQAIHKLNKQTDDENAIALKPLKKKIRIVNVKPKRKLTMKKSTAKSNEQIAPEMGETRECPSEPPPLPADYAEAVARARQLAGYKNETAALNPEAAAEIARQKAAVETETAAFAALPEHEKLKVRMECLRSKLHRHGRIKPTIEQLAFLQHMKEKCEYVAPNTDPSTPKTVEDIPSLSDTPCVSQNSTAETSDLAKFEALEKMLAPQGQFSQAMPQENSAFRQRIADLQQQLLTSEVADNSLAEFEAIEAREAPPDQCPAWPPGTLHQLSRRIAEMQQEQLATPVEINSRERYKELLIQMQTSPKTPVEPSPVKTPEIRYSPIHFSLTSPDRKKSAQKRSGDSTITEEVTETAEIVNGELQHVTKNVTIVTDQYGHKTAYINENKTMEAIEDLEDIREPSFLDMTPISPTDAPRPRDIINRIRRDVQCRSRPPEVPTARLIELGTPSRELPLPQEVLEEQLIEITCPTLPKTPARTPTHSAKRSPERASNISIPEFFVATPPSSTLPPVSPLRHHTPSPDNPITITSHPKDPTDYAAMVKRTRKMHQLQVQEEGESLAATEAAQSTQTEASKLKKMKGVPPFKSTTPLLKKVLMGKTKLKAGPIKSVHLPPPLPEGYTEHVARARRLAGLKNSTEAKVTAATVDATECANASLPPPADFETLMSRIAALREKGSALQAQPSMEAAAYLGALKSVMDVMDSIPTEEVKAVSEISPESPETRYRRIMNARRELPFPPSIEFSQVQSPPCGDITYTPIRFVSPRVGDYRANAANGIAEFNMANFIGLQDLGELDELEEPSFGELSIVDIDGYTLPSQSPRTPQPSPSQLINRIRDDVYQKLASTNLIYPTPRRTSPPTLDLPVNLTEEDLFEMSVPRFAETPQQHQTPTKSPNVSIPLYFETTPKIPTPKVGIPSRSNVPLAEEESLPTLLGVCPGVRVETPEGPIVIPPHPKDPTDLLAIIKRAQLIRKLELKRDADEAKRPVHKLAKGARVPISRRPRGAPARKVQKPPRKLQKLLEPIQKRESECPMQPPELPPTICASVAAKPPQDYATIMARAAALRAKTGQYPPTARELAAAQNLINLRQKLERGRQLCELEQRRKTQPEDVSLNLGQLQTPPPLMERFRMLKARMPSETPITSRILHEYSPVKTPDGTDLPVYSPIHLAPSPPCPYLQNISEPAIGNVSMPVELQSDYDDTNINVEVNNNFDLNRRIQFLQNQYLHSPRHISISPRSAGVLPNTLDSPGLAEFEVLEREGGVLQALPANPSQRTDIKQMVDDLNRLEQISRAQEKLLCEGEIAQNPGSDTSPRKSSVIGEYSALDLFEAMDRLCRTPHQR